MNLKKNFNINNLSNIDKDINLIDFSFSLDKIESFTEQDFLINSKEQYIALNLKMSPENKNVDKKNAISTKVNVKIGGLSQQDFNEKEFIRVTTLIKNQLDNILNYDLSTFEELQADGVVAWKQLLNKFTNKDKFREYFNLKNLTDEDLSLVSFTFTIDTKETLNEHNIALNSNGKYIALNLKMSPEDKNVDKKNELSTKVNVKIGGLDQEEFDEKEFIRVTTLIKSQLDNILKYDLSIFEELQADGKMTWTQLLNKFVNKDKFRKYFNLKNLTDEDLILVDFSFTIDESETLNGHNIALNSNGKYIALNLKMSPKDKNVDKKNELSTKVNVKIGGLDQEEFDEKEFIRVTTLIKNQLDNILNYDLSIFEELQADGKITWTQLLNKFVNKDKFRKYFNLKNLTDEDLILVDFSFTIDESETLNGHNIALNSNGKYIALNLKMSPKDKNVDKKNELSTKVNVKIGGINQEEFDEKEFIRVTTLIKSQLNNILNYDLSIFEELQADGEMNWRELLGKLDNKAKFKEYFNFKDLTYKDLDLINFTFTIDSNENLYGRNIVLNSKNKYITLNLKMSPEDKNIDMKNVISTKMNVKIGGLDQKEVNEKEFIRVTTLIKNQLENISNYDLTNWSELKVYGQMTWRQWLDKFVDKDKFREYFKFENLSDNDLGLINFTFTFDSNEHLNEHNNALKSNDEYITLNIKMLPKDKNIDTKYAISTKIKVKISKSLDVVVKMAWDKIRSAFYDFDSLTLKYLGKKISFIKNEINNVLQKIIVETAEIQRQSNLVWKIEITDDTLDDSVILLEQNYLHWNVHLSLNELNTNKLIYDENKNFGSSTEFTQEERDLYIAITNSFKKFMQNFKFEKIKKLDSSNIWPVFFDFNAIIYDYDSYLDWTYLVNQYSNETQEINKGFPSSGQWPFFKQFIEEINEVFSELYPYVRYYDSDEFVIVLEKFAYDKDLYLPSFNDDDSTNYFNGMVNVIKHIIITAFIPLFKLHKGELIF